MSGIRRQPSLGWRAVPRALLSWTERSSDGTTSETASQREALSVAPASTICRAGAYEAHDPGMTGEQGNDQGGIIMADAGPPLALMAFGLVLWLAVNATLAGISIQTVGIILFLAGALWLVIELFQSRAVLGRRRATCRPRRARRARARDLLTPGRDSPTAWQQPSASTAQPGTSARG